MNSIDLVPVESVINTLLASRYQGNTVFVVGNAGSAAMAGYIATDLMLGSNLLNPSLRVFSLAGSVATTTTIGNDQNFDLVFPRQLSRLVRPGDVLLAVSAPGNSRMILKCVEVAKDVGMESIGFIIGRVRELADQVKPLANVSTRSGAYGAVEDMQFAINHTITEQLPYAAEGEARH